MMAEGLVELGATGEAEYIGDDRMLGQRFEGEFLQLGQGDAPAERSRSDSER